MRDGLVCTCLSLRIIFANRRTNEPSYVAAYWLADTREKLKLNAWKLLRHLKLAEAGIGITPPIHPVVADNKAAQQRRRATNPTKGGARRFLLVRLPPTRRQHVARTPARQTAAAHWRPPTSHR